MSKKNIKLKISLLSGFLLACFAPLYAQAQFITGTSANMGIGAYIKMIYVYGIGIVGILATIVIMIGGLIWISSMGNAARVTEAKDWIGAALTGLALAMFSYMILWIINPNLVGFNEIEPRQVEAIKEENNETTQTTTGCCLINGMGGVPSRARTTTSNICIDSQETFYPGLVANSNFSGCGPR